MTAAIRTVVVDDDYRVAAIHAAYVSRCEGFEVVGEAHNGNEAMQVISEVKPDLLLMDVFLPDRDGLSLCRELFAEPEHPDVIVITAAREIATVREAMQLGAVHYLMKPFGWSALNERLQAYRHLRQRMSGLPDAAEQADVDELFSMMRGTATAMERPGKGHSAPTLELVRDTVKAAGDDVSAAEIAVTLGISRSTAQRYLTYLERHGVLKLQLRYGSTGRPEHRYVTASADT